MDLKNSCQACAKIPPENGADQQCCLAAFLRSRLRAAIDKSLKADADALKQQSAAEHTKNALAKCEMEKLGLVNRVEELQKQIQCLQKQIEEAKDASANSEVDRAAEDAALAVSQMDIEEEEEPTETGNPCVLLYTDKGLRKLKLGKPDVDLYAHFAGHLIFGNFVGFATMTTVKVAEMTAKFLQRNDVTKVHIVCHLGVDELVQDAESGLSAAEVAQRIIKPLAGLLVNSRVLSVTWCTMIEHGSNQTVAAVNTEALKVEEVRCGTVSIIDLRQICRDTRNVCASNPEDPLTFRLSAIGQKIAFNRLKRAVEEVLNLREEDLAKVAQAREKFVSFQADKNEQAKQRALVVAEKKRLLEEAVAKVAQQKCPTCKGGKETKRASFVTPPSQASSSEKNHRARSPRRSVENTPKRRKQHSVDGNRRPSSARREDPQPSERTSDRSGASRGRGGRGGHSSRGRGKPHV